MRDFCCGRVWINWPRDKYASIAVALHLELSELSGRCHFGVVKNASFFSFLEEPYTRFKVNSEFGDQFKIRNLPKLSDIVIKKLKKTISKKAVYPNAHKFRLIWPRHWWPKGTENDFLPSGQQQEQQQSKTHSHESVDVTPSDMDISCAHNEDVELETGTAAAALAGTAATGVVNSGIENAALVTPTKDTQVSSKKSGLSSWISRLKKGSKPRDDESSGAASVATAMAISSPEEIVAPMVCRPAVAQAVAGAVAAGKLARIEPPSRSSVTPPERRWSTGLVVDCFLANQSDDDDSGDTAVRKRSRSQGDELCARSSRVRHRANCRMVMQRAALIECDFRRPLQGADSATASAKSSSGAPCDVASASITGHSAALKSTVQTQPQQQQQQQHTRLGSMFRVGKESLSQMRLGVMKMRQRLDSTDA